MKPVEYSAQFTVPTNYFIQDCSIHIESHDHSTTSGNRVILLLWFQRSVLFSFQVNTDRFRHTITNPSIVQDFPVDVLRAMGSDRFVGFTIFILFCFRWQHSNINLTLWLVTRMFSVVHLRDYCCFSSQDLTIESTHLYYRASEIVSAVV